MVLHIFMNKAKLQPIKGIFLDYSYKGVYYISRGEDMFFFFNNVPFIAVIGDIRGSKRLNNRKEIQDKLREILDKINNKYISDIAAKFVITLGDEFQGLLSAEENLLNILQEIRIQLFPVELRYGIGIGEITTDIDTEMALGADGPGYYNARSAIEMVRQNEKKNKAVLTDVRLNIGDDDNKQVVLINTIFELIKVIERGWTDKQREIIWDMLQHQDGQVEVAHRLGITQSYVQKVLAKEGYYTYEKALKDINCSLGGLINEKGNI